MNAPSRPLKHVSDQTLSQDLAYWRHVKTTDAGVEMQNHAWARIEEINEEIGRRAGRAV